jgi:uncharacterized membrane protein
MKHWFIYLMMFAFVSITTLIFIIFYEVERIKERETLQQYYAEHPLSEPIKPAYDESMMNPDAKM